MDVVIGEQMADNDQDGAADRDDGSFAAVPSGDAPVAFTEERVGAAAPTAASPSARAR